MPVYSSINNILSEIKSELDTQAKPDKIKVSILYACNTSGKTRLSTLFNEQYEAEVLCYNAFVEDLFHWNNDTLRLYVDKNSWLVQLIKSEGLEGDIIDNFKKLMNSKIEPSFDLENGIITFGNYTGDSATVENVKISRGEESLFIWSVFYTILDNAIANLQQEASNRSTHYFDTIKYVVIDDPVSSMDDIRIITVALELIALINKIEHFDNKLKFLITTHHCLFYNILHSEKIKEWHKQAYILSKTENNEYSLERQSNDSPFAYHNLIFAEILKAVNENNIQKYHFNLFRAILEKTANFLGYTKKWDCLLEDNEDKKKLLKLLNLYSHNSLSEIEAIKILPEDLTIFKNAFNSFKDRFHWSCEHE